MRPPTSREGRTHRKGIYQSLLQHKAGVKLLIIKYDRRPQPASYLGLLEPDAESRIEAGLCISAELIDLNITKKFHSCHSGVQSNRGMKENHGLKDIEPQKCPEKAWPI